MISPHDGTGSVGARIRWSFLPFLVVALMAVIVGGCSDSSDPTGPDIAPEYDYYPITENVDLDITRNLFFQVTAASSVDYSVEWIVGDELRKVAPTFTYFPASVGRDTVRAIVKSGSHTDEHQWSVRILSTSTDRPDEVTGVNLEDGPLPGEISVSWLKVITSVYPISEYEVAMSYDGAVSTDNWDSATILDTIASDGSLQYARIYDLEYGADVWFGVRARDELGQMSPINRPYHHLVTYPWTLGVMVKNPEGLPVPQVILKWSADGVSQPAGNTPTSGFLEIGPFRNIDAISLETQINNEGVMGEYYDFIDSRILESDGLELDIVLMPRYGSDEACDSGFEGDFLEYFRYMTRTKTTYALRPNQYLLKWDNYPLRIFVPDMVREDGVDMAAAAWAGIEFWNRLMGEIYFIAVDSEGLADVVVGFPRMDAHFGLVSILEPSDEDYFIGSVIPEKVSLDIDSYRLTSDSDFLQITIMHELGHVLGIGNHAPCSDAGYLMYNAVSSDLTDENEGIHPDERHLVHMIRHLPQAIDMSFYVLD